MNATLAIARRELDALFATPLGWLALCGFVIVTGFFFVFAVYEFNSYAVQAAFSPSMADQLTVNDWLIPAIFGNWSVVLLLMMPALSMRIFAEDIRQRSFELLLSSPLTSPQIVFGKFLGALGFLAVLFASTLYQPAVLFWLGSPDPGVLAASYASMFLLSAACLAVGMWVSAYTSNQIVAFIVSFSILLLLYLLGWVGTVTDEGLLGALGKASMLSHLEQLGKGLLHTKDLAYFAAFIGFFVFATVQRVEGFRWSVGLGGGSRTLSDAAWDIGAGIGLLFVLSKVIRLARDGTAGVWEGTANLAWLGLATTGLVLVAAWAWRNRDALTASAAEPGARLMAGSAALVTVGLGVAVGGYALAERYDRRFDLTASQRFTLSDQTKSLVGALGQDVQVLGFFAPGSPEESTAKDLLAGYTALSPRIDVAFHDPQAEPMLARQYEIAHDYGTIILQSGDRKQRIESGFTEEKLTNALLRLGDSKTHTLCFTAGHDELDPNDDMEPTGIGLAVRKAEGQNYTAKAVVLAREPAVPADCSVLVVADPRLDFLPVERERAAAWVAGGGALFVLLKPTSAPALAADLARYGVQVGNDIVVEQNPAYAVAGNDPTWVVLDPQSFDLHPITEKLKGAVMLRAARSVGKAAAVPEGLAVQELARTTAYGWGETDLTNPTLALDPATDRPGPVPLMVAVEVKDPSGLRVGDTTLSAGEGARPLPTAEAAAPSPGADGPVASPAASADAPAPPAPPAAAPGADGAAPPADPAAAVAAAAPPAGAKAGGKVVVIGESDFASNMMLDQFANQDLFLNTIAWMVGEEDQLGIRPNEAAAGTIEYTALQFLGIVLGSLLFAPGLTLVAAVGTWRRRQGR